MLSPLESTIKALGSNFANIPVASRFKALMRLGKGYARMSPNTFEMLDFKPLSEAPTSVLSQLPTSPLAKVSGVHVGPFAGNTRSTSFLSEPTVDTISSLPSTAIHESMHERFLRYIPFVEKVKMQDMWNGVDSHVKAHVANLFGMPELQNAEEFFSEISARQLSGENVGGFLRKFFGKDFSHDFMRWLAKNKLLIMSTLGASGAISSLTPTSEASAFDVKPIAPLTKETLKILKSPKPFHTSSAASALEGKSYLGWVIEKVLRPKGFKSTQRLLTLFNPETGSRKQWVMDDEALATLSAVVGNQTYMQKFASQPTRLAKAKQALKSLEHRHEQGVYAPTLREAKDAVNRYVSKASLLNPEGTELINPPVDLSFVRWKGNTYPLPHKYASLLEKVRNRPPNAWMRAQTKDFRLLKTEPKAVRKPAIYYILKPTSEGGYDIETFRTSFEKLNELKREGIASSLEKRGYKFIDKPNDLLPYIESMYENLSTLEM